MPIVYSILVFLGEERMSQTWNLQQVQQHYQQCKEQLPDPVRLRIHRSFSWLKQAAVNSSEDLQFMCLWVAFNAAYAKDLQNHDKPSESEEFRHFLQQICKADNQDIYQLIWQTYSASIRTLLDSQYVFQPTETTVDAQTHRVWQLFLTLLIMLLYLLQIPCLTHAVFPINTELNIRLAFNHTQALSIFNALKHKSLQNTFENHTHHQHPDYLSTIFD